MPVASFDHVALPTNKPEEMIAFYGALGFEVPDLARWRAAGVPFFSIHFGNQKINLHIKGHEFEPKADKPTPGSLDLCFIASEPLDSVIVRLNELKVTIVEGPVMRTGATSRIRSVYLRDPDQNLIEISELHP